jgi:integrase
MYAFPRHLSHTDLESLLSSPTPMQGGASNKEAVVSIYKRNGSKIWLIDLATPTGRRVRKSSGTDDRAEAKKREAQLRLELSDPVFDIQASQSIQLSKLIQRFLAYQRGVGKKSMESFYEPACKIFEAWAGPERDVITLSLPDLQRFQAERAGAASPSTANRDFQVLKRMFNLAVRWGLLEKNPCLHVERLKEPAGRERFLDQVEQQKLLKCCAEPFRTLIFVALRTGMRRGELLGLRRRDVDFSRSLITLRVTKSGSPRHLPMLPQVREALIRLAKTRAEDEKLFVSSKGRPYSGDGVQSNFLRACRRAQLLDFHFHDLRHTYASDCVAAGMELAVLAKLLGHKSVKTTERYAHLGESQVREAVRLLDGHLAAQLRHSQMDLGLE